MRFSQESANNGYTILTIQAEGITVQAPNGERVLLNSSFIIAQDHLIRDWSPRQLDHLSPQHLEPILGLSPEVVLLGTGQRQHFPPAALLLPLINGGIGYEVMDTAAACRTYNVLVGEGRKVVAALLLP